MSPISLSAASPHDVDSIARLHAQSWRSAYRGMLSDEYLDEHVVADRLEFWSTRFANVAPDRRLVLRAVSDGMLLGFVPLLVSPIPRLRGDMVSG